MAMLTIEDENQKKGSDKPLEMALWERLPLGVRGGNGPMALARRKVYSQNPHFCAKPLRKPFPLASKKAKNKVHRARGGFLLLHVPQ